MCAFGARRYFNVYGGIGKLIDILALFATAGGVATSLGLGVLQINSGLHFLADVPETRTVQILLIAILAFLYIVTAIIGIERGISLVSNINVVIASNACGAPQTAKQRLPV